MGYCSGSLAPRTLAPTKAPHFETLEAIEGGCPDGWDEDGEYDEGDLVAVVISDPRRILRGEEPPVKGSLRQKQDEALQLQKEETNIRKGVRAGSLAERELKEKQKKALTPSPKPTSQFCFSPTSSPSTSTSAPFTVSPSFSPTSSPTTASPSKSPTHSVRAPFYDL